MKRWFMLYIVAHSILFVCIAQTVYDTQKFQRAQQFEEYQQWTEAVPLYEELYRANPDNYLYFSGLQRGYVQLKRYDDAIALTLQWLQRHPNDIAIKIGLGTLYFNAGEPKRADSLWNVVLTEAGTNVAVHRIVAQEMLQNRLYDAAIETYRKARSISKNPTLFADEIGMLYFSLQRYEQGAEEYIKALLQKPENFHFVQSRFAAYASRTEAMKAVQDVLLQTLRREKNNLTLLRLSIWLQLQLKQYFDAIETAQQLDRLEQTTGNELFQLAQRLTNERNFVPASYAYYEYIRQYPQQPQALFGFGYTLHELARQIDTMTFEDRETIRLDTLPVKLPFTVSLSHALRWYQEVLHSSPPPELAAHTWFRIGLLYYDDIQNLDSALAAFRMVTNLQRNTTLYFDAVQKLGEVYTALGALREAQVYFALTTFSPNEQTRQQGQYFLACLEYYQSHFDSARTLLKSLTTQLSSPIANDALTLHLFIEENITAAPQALAEFARAEYLTQQRKYAEAIALYRSLIQRYPSAPLIDDAYINLGILFLKQRRIPEALTAFRTLADSLPLSIWKEKALWYIGLIHERVTRQSLQAIKAYEELLTRYPNSLYADECRKRIRALRGDAIRIQ